MMDLHDQEFAVQQAGEQASHVHAAATCIHIDVVLLNQCGHALKTMSHLSAIQRRVARSAPPVMEKLDVHIYESLIA